jgi:hypothetical protein
MGDVDQADQLALAYSKVDFTRTLRWPTVLFQWYFDTARVNAYVLHRRAAESQRHVGRQDRVTKQCIVIGAGTPCITEKAFRQTSPTWKNG